MLDEHHPAAHLFADVTEGLEKRWHLVLVEARSRFVHHEIARFRRDGASQSGKPGEAVWKTRCGVRSHMHQAKHVERFRSAPCCFPPARSHTESSQRSVLRDA